MARIFWAYLLGSSVDLSFCTILSYPVFNKLRARFALYPRALRMAIAKLVSDSPVPENPVPENPVPDSPAIYNSVTGTFSKDALKAALDKLSGVSMIVIGDAIVDRYIWGEVERISPEAPVPILDVVKAEDRLGGAANVAHNLSQLGINVSLAALVGDDDEAESLRALLSSQKINPDMLVVDKERCTTVKTRVMAGQQQIVRIDHEVRASASQQAQQQLAKAVLKVGAKGLVVSDYGKGVVVPAVLEAIESVVISGASVMVDPHPSNYERYRKLGMCKPNRKEAEAATGIKITDNATAAQAAKILLSNWGCSTVVLSLGGGGVCIVENINPAPLFLPTKARQVFDVSGAGDALAAVFAACKHAGLSTAISGELANLAAGVVVSQVGTVPVTKALLEQAIEQTEF